MKRKKLKSILVLIYVVLISTYSYGVNKFYITELGAGNKDGSSWDNAFDVSQLQNAINDVDMPGEIWLAQGTYNITTSLQMRNSIAIYGGFQGNETVINQRNIIKYPTIIQGTNSMQYVINNPTSLNNNAILDGFTIKTSKYAVILTKGGTFNNCKFSNAPSYGIYVSTGIFTNCEVSQITGSYGIGIYMSNGTFDNVKVDGCLYYGIASCDGVFTNCTIINNSNIGISDGNAIYKNCFISKNKNAIINSKNTFVNCIISNNEVGITDSEGKIINCNIIQNSKYGINVSKSCEIVNCILWGNSKQIQYSASGTTFSYCAIQGGYTYPDGDLGNNISLSVDNEDLNGPNFFDISNDLALKNNSPCIDKGNNLKNTEIYDMVLNNRINNQIIDIGCVEFNSQYTSIKIILSTDTLYLNGEQGSTETFNIQTENNWTISSNVNWLQINKITGISTSDILITVDENTGKIRKAELKINAPNVFSKTLIVIQNVGTKNITLTAGQLSSILTSDDKLNVSSLKLTGTIDARDFKTMRDEMPKLSSLDISDANIVSYTGTGGTYSTTFYPANCIPFCAFKKGTISTVNDVLKNIILPKTLIEIGQQAFSLCVKLNNVVIPNSVTMINSSAFSYCNSLTEFVIPSNVSLIGPSAFSHCANLITIDFKSNLITDLNADLFTNCTSLKNINLPTSISYMDGSVFNNCTSLETIILPPLVDWITGGCFGNCTNLKSVTLPINLTGISNGAFANCIALKSISIPDNVYALGNNAFQNCTGLTSIQIPAGVYDIRNSVFEGCANLTAIYVNRNVPVDLSGKTYVFQYVDKTKCVLYVPEGTKSAYENANQWQDFLFIQENTNIPLEISTNEINITKFSYTNSVNILSNSSYTISSNVDWIQTNITSGTGNNSFTIQISENSGFPRNGIITIETTEGLIKTINVSQQGEIVELPFLNLSTDTIYISNNDINLSEIEIFTNTSWKLINNATWLLLTPTTQKTGDGYISINAGKNIGQTRTAEIEISNNGNLVQKLTVIQEGVVISKLESIKNEINVYPNPTSDYLNTTITYDKIIIYNALGVRVKTIYPNSNIIYLPNFMNGNYFMLLYKQNNVYKHNLEIIH